MQYFFNGFRFHCKNLELCRGGISTYSGQVSLKNVEVAKSFQCLNFKNIKITFWMFFCYYNTDFFNFWWFWKEPLAMMAIKTTSYFDRCLMWHPSASVHNCSLFPNDNTALLRDRTGKLFQISFKTTFSWSLLVLASGCIVHTVAT